MAASQPAVAVAIIGTTPANGLRFKHPQIPGERALWLYIRGAARAAIGYAGARDDLQQATLAEPRDWVRARAHVELGKLALLASDDEQARADFAAATFYGRRGGDRFAIDLATRLRRKRTTD